MKESNNTTQSPWINPIEWVFFIGLLLFTGYSFFQLVDPQARPQVSQVVESIKKKPINRQLASPSHGNPDRIPASPNRAF